MVAAAFAAVLGWTEHNTRGLNLITQSVQSLCELNLLLPAEAQATLFQVRTILSDVEWRDEVLRFLSPNSQSFWRTRFTKQTGGDEAITPVTNPIDRIRSSRHMAALFGQSQSTFDMRQAMDDGAIILLCPGEGDKSQLVHALFLFELFRATLSRRDTPADRRRICHAFLDEMQVADSGQGSEFIARIFREARKFGLRLHAMVQQPTALSAATLSAALTNRSMLTSTVVSARDASILAKEWGDVVAPYAIVNQRQFDYLGSVTMGRDISPPFRVTGLSVTEAWGEPEGVADGSAAAAIDRAIDANMARRPVDEVLADLDTLDSRILAHLGSIRPEVVPDPPTAPRRRRKSAGDRPALPAGVASIERARPAWRDQ